MFAGDHMHTLRGGPGDFNAFQDIFHRMAWNKYVA